jgi:hypothetical protein
MPTYANDLRLKEITTGDESGTWGTSTNTNLALIADAFSLGTKQMAANADETFTMPDATADGVRSLYLKITSAVSLTATRTVTLAPNTVSKVWIIENATTGSQSITIAQGSGATVTVPTGQKVMLVTDGAGGGAAVTNANPTVNLTGATESVSPFETALGSGAGVVNTGVNNTFIGFESGNDNTTGTNNTAVGYQALDANTTGINNTAVGSGALGANTVGTGNVAVGTSALLLNTTGTNNTAVGASTLDANTTGVDNVAVGSNALGANTIGTGNVAVGTSSLLLNTTGTNNTAVGHLTLDANTTGINNVAVGSGALGANTVGINNTAVGTSALLVNTTGTGNTAVGHLTLDANTTGVDNVAMGRNALGANTTASFNVALGLDALLVNTTGANNTALGAETLDANTTGVDNVAVGYQAGDKITTGTQNVTLGTGAASSGTNDLTTGSNNIILGYNAAASSATVSNELTVGNSSITKFRLPGLSIDWAANDVPFRNIPQNSQSAAYTLVAADASKHIFHPSADTTARTFTIPANGSVPFPIGTAVTFINQNGAGVITIAITTDTMRLAGAGTTGSRTLAANGVATAVKITSTEWIISGTGLT